MASHAYHQAFAEPFVIDRRKFDAVYLLYASSGAFILDISDRRWLLPPQRAALIAGGTEISVRTKAPTTASSVLFDPQLFHTLPDCRVFGMSELACHMVAYAMRWDREAPASSSDSVTFFTALSSVVRELAAVEEETWLPRPRSDGVVRAVDYLLDRLDHDVEFSELASVAHLSERTFARRVDEELGMTLRDFRHRARMIKAKELLVGSRAAVTEIGFACGFSSPSSFIKAFRNFTSMTPRQYRGSGLRLTA